MNPYRVLLYYKFTPIADPVSFAAEHIELCRSLGLLGRIIVAEEGINGTLSGLASGCKTYMSEMSALLGTVEFKIDEAEEHAFKKLFVRARPEIITLGEGVGGKGGPGLYLEPADWLAMMGRDDVVLLDGRNDYESELGRFEGAICPPVENFREIPGWLETHRDLFLGKTVLTYCTGGIRCEKLSAWMLSNGFANVYQLHGGISTYAQDPSTQGEGFEGVNVVFDDRVVISAGERSKAITRCRECGELSTNHVNCANVECNKRMIQCATCEEIKARCCSDDCRNAARRRLKGRKLHESARR